MKVLSVILVVFGIITLSSCSHYNAKAPSGYGVFDEGDDFRALSSEGVVFRVKELENEPKASLNFWKEALSHKMKASGYIFIKESKLKIDSNEAVQLEWGSFYNKSDYTYINTLVVKDDWIFVVEVAGESSLIEKDRKAISKAIQEVEFK